MVQDYFTRREPAKSRDYEQSYWGTIVDPDGNVRNRLEERERYLDDVKQELAFLNSLPPGRIVDVGCGLGFLLSGLKSGWEKHGVEVSSFAAEHARQWGKIHVGELEGAKYPNEHFDVVVMYHTIEHMEDPIGTILEVRRILKRGGVLLLGTPDFDSGCARRFGENYRLLHDQTHVSLFTNDSMHRFLRDHGFVIDRVEYPFFETRYFTRKNLVRLLNTSKISPPFYGNFMTFYCHKPNRGHVHEAIMDLSQLAGRVADSLEGQIEQGGMLVADCLQAGGKVLVCGNGGSAAAAQHFAAELIVKLRRERQPLAAIALTADSSVLTAIGNDYGFTEIFARQIEALAQAGDVLIIITTSGRSANILRAIEVARRKNLSTIALLGEAEMNLIDGCDVCIRVPTSDPQRIQEAHTVILHVICELVEQGLKPTGL